MTETSPAPVRRFIGTLTLNSKPKLVTEPASVTKPEPPVPVPAPVPIPAPPPATEVADVVPPRIVRRVADLAHCRATFPGMFDAAQPRPLAIGIYRQLVPVLTAKRAHAVLQWWTRCPAYVAAIAAGGPRFNLDGSEAGQISDEQRAFARRGKTGQAAREAAATRDGEVAVPQNSDALNEQDRSVSAGG